jgi:anti-sigma-K factor RskA
VSRDSSLTDVHALAGAYALDALTEIERAAFARHVEGCESCALEVAELSETAVRLVDSTATAPPPGLKANVLAEIALTPQARGGGPGDDKARTAPASAQRWRRWTAAAVAAGIVAVGAAVVTWAVDQQRVHDARAEAAQLRSLLTEPDVRVRTTRVEGGQVTVIVSPSRNAGVAILANLAAPGSGKAYELWLIRGGKAGKAGLLAAGERGGTKQLGPIDDASAFAVSRERAEGVDHPTDVVGGVVF